MGVDRDADYDVIKRAYTDRAMRLHPDRLHDAPPDELERAEYRMRELNGAWAVLRDDRKRKAYDKELASQSFVPTSAPAVKWQEFDDLPEPERDEPAASRAGHGAGRHGAGRGGGGAGGASQRSAAPDDAPASVRTAWRLVMPLLVLGGALILGAVVIAIAGGGSPENVDVQTTEAYPEGACVLERPGPRLEAVACSAPNSGTVVDKRPFPQPCPPETRAIVVPADGISVCVRDVAASG